MQTLHTERKGQRSGLSPDKGQVKTTSTRAIVPALAVALFSASLLAACQTTTSANVTAKSNSCADAYNYCDKGK